MYFSYIFNVDRLVFLLDLDDVQDSLFCNNTTGHNMRHVESRDAKETEASINISLPFLNPRSDVTHTGKLVATRSALQLLRAPLFLLHSEGLCRNVHMIVCDISESDILTQFLVRNITKFVQGLHKICFGCCVQRGQLEVTSSNRKRTE